MRSSRFETLSLAFGLWAVLAGPAAAQPTTTAAVMPSTGGHREIPEETRTAATEAAIGFLRNEDLLVLDANRVQISLDETQRACTPGTDCMADVRSALGVDVLAGLILWGRAEARGEAHTVHATLLDGTGTRYLGTAEVVRGVPTAVRDALRAAREAQRRGPGPFLSIHGTRGAIVELDGAGIGSIPLENVRTEPGEHELYVSLEGYEPQTLDVTVGDDRSRTTSVEVELRPDGSDGGTPSTPDGIAAWAMPVGIAGIVAGLGIGVGVPVGGALSTGCAGMTETNCARSAELDVGAAVAWGVAGGALAIAGLTLVIVAATEEGGPSANARLGPNGLTIEGSF